ncbi:hypothetical protein ATHEMM101B_14860 [Atlantibacter hermannii]|uniref:hypothetical protein n=1 Tax=Atlantibacter hermannii TaxID=565 RepID=UPI000EC6B797|nr:hypothetical protein [Shigella sp.]
MIVNIVHLSAEIEKQLKDNGATGAGLKELRESISDRLSNDVISNLKFITHLRNKVVHENYSCNDYEAQSFISKSTQVIEYLKKLSKESYENISASRIKEFYDPSWHKIYFHEGFAEIQKITYQLRSPISNSPTEGVERNSTDEFFERLKLEDARYELAVKHKIIEGIAKHQALDILELWVRKGVAYAIKNRLPLYPKESLRKQKELTKTDLLPVLGVAGLVGVGYWLKKNS